jgi:hypothetical protein
MKIYIKVKPKSKKEFVKKIDDTHYVVAVSEPPTEGKANNAVIEALAEFFQTPKSQIFIISGKSSRQKIVEI